MKKICTFFVVCSLFFVSTSFALTLRPQWAPQCQFAGYYMAVEKGFYKEAGIDLTIKDGGPGITGLQEVNERKTDFATSWLISALRMRAKGQKIVLIGQFFQKPALMLLAHKSANIHSPEQFQGHTLGVWPGDFQIPPKALIRKLHLKDVNITNQPFDVTPFINGEIDIASAMRYNEYHQVLDAGIPAEELTIFNFSDFGMNLPEDGIYVHEDFLASHPEKCRKMIQASIKGWQYAFAHKEETIALITSLANKTSFKTSASKQKSMLEEIEKLMDLNNTSLSQEDFQTAVNELQRTKMIRKGIQFKSFAPQF